jgi:holo-ACP synthase
MVGVLCQRSAVSMNDMLIAREERAARQAVAFTQFNRPLLSVTVVMPGSTKDSRLVRRVMKSALQQIDALIHRKRWHLLSREVFWQNTGPQAIFVLDIEAQVLKSAAMHLEGRHPIGRLWDLDVITASGEGLSRSQLWRPARRCLLCALPARECSRSCRHPLPELLKEIQRMVDELDRHRRT